MNLNVMGAKVSGAFETIGNAAVNGVASSATSQAIARVTGLQSSFSWAGVAAAGVGAAVGNFAGGKLGGGGFASAVGPTGTGLAVGAASLIASAATRSAIEGSNFGRNVMAGLPDVIGQVLGRALVGVAGGSKGPSAVKRDRDDQTDGDPTLQQPNQMMTGKVVIQGQENRSGDQPLVDLSELVALGLDMEDVEVLLSFDEQGTSAINGESDIIHVTANPSHRNFEIFRRNMEEFYDSDSNVRALSDSVFGNEYVPSDHIRDENFQATLRLIDRLERRGNSLSTARANDVEYLYLVARGGLRLATFDRLTFSMARLETQFMFAGASDPEAVAAGVVANLWKESGGTFDPSVTEDGGARRRGPGEGIAQWTTRDRKDKFLERFGVPVLEGTLMQQLDFLVQEMTDRRLYFSGPNPSNDTSLYSAGQNVINARTPEQAARVFMVDIENPRDQSQAAQTGRADIAREIYDFGQLRSARFQYYLQMRSRI